MPPSPSSRPAAQQCNWRWEGDCLNFLESKPIFRFRKGIGNIRKYQYFPGSLYLNLEYAPLSPHCQGQLAHPSLAPTTGSGTGGSDGCTDANSHCRWRAWCWSWPPSWPPTWNSGPQGDFPVKSTWPLHQEANWRVISIKDCDGLRKTLSQQGYRGACPGRKINGSTIHSEQS